MAPFTSPSAAARSSLRCGLIFAVLAAGSAGLHAGEAATPPAPAGAVASETTRINLDSLVRLTYQNNLSIAIERDEFESAKLSFERFVRNQSGFTPFIFDTGVSREVQSELDDGVREKESSYSGDVSVGMEKEFFDGTNIEAQVGMSGEQDDANRRVGRPFAEVGLSMPLIGSITRLERTIERTFEETELFRAWLGFIEEVREAIGGSLQSYVFFQENLAERRRIEQVLAEYRQLEQNPALANRAGDLAQIRGQIQDYLSDLAGLEGQIENGRISLLDSIGLQSMGMDQVDALAIDATNLRGAGYLERTVQSVIDEALQNDIEIQVLRVQRDNAELELQLAQRGKWDLSGRLSGRYDFTSRGDDPSRQRGYEVGVGFSIQRNDPKLLDLSVRQSRAEIRQIEAQIAQRNRNLASEIRQNLIQAGSTRRVIQELTTSVQSRRALYDSERQDFLAGTESVENLIRARSELFETEGELMEEILEFYDLMLDLDESSGRFFVQLGDLVPQFEGPAGLGVSADRGGLLNR